MPIFNILGEEESSRRDRKKTRGVQPPEDKGIVGRKYICLRTHFQNREVLLNNSLKRALGKNNVHLITENAQWWL